MLLWSWLLSSLLLVISHAAEETNYILDFRRLGPVFDGIGGLSGGGATSKLLYSVNESIRQNVLETLFSPKKIGLSMLKIELGGDDQSTDGSEASHWPTPDHFEFKRGYEWRLVRDSLKVNPNLKICILAWAFPNWVGDPNKNPENASKYIVSWITEAYKVINVTTYCVGLWNERSWTENYAITLRKTLDAAGLPFRPKLVVGDSFRTSDEDFNRMLAPNFTDYVDIIGVHYPGGKLPAFVQSSGKTLWASEDFSTIAAVTNPRGFGCMVRTLNWNYVYGNMTGSIFWHMVSAFYKELPYFGASLMMPTKPDYSVFNITQVVSPLHQVIGVVRPGWRFLTHGFGSGVLKQGGTYVTYTNGTHFALVVETMTAMRSKCFYSNPKNLTVAKSQKVSFTWIEGPNLSKVYAFDGFTVKKIAVKNGTFSSIIYRNEQVTFVGHLPSSFPLYPRSKFEIPNPVVPKPSCPGVKNCEGDFFDDYSNYENGEEARWLSPQKGSWLVYNGSLLQTVTLPPVSWCAGDINTPIAVIPGKSVSVDVRRLDDSSPFPFLGLRTNCTGCEVNTCRGIFVTVDNKQGRIFTNFSSWEPIATFALTEQAKANEKNHFSLKLLAENKILVTFGPTTQIFSNLTIPTHGMAAIGTTGYGVTEWDNLFVEEPFTPNKSSAYLVFSVILILLTLV